MPMLCECEMAGVPLPEQGVQGRSFTRLVAGQDAAWSGCAFSERGGSMVRTAQYKLIRNAEKDARTNGAYELYDLLSDPQPKASNLAAKPAGKAKKKRNRASEE